MWQVWVDTGGTFTDCVAIDPVGAVHRAKLLSSGVVRGTVVRWTDAQRVVVRLPGVVDARSVVGWTFAVDDGVADGSANPPATSDLRQATVVGAQSAGKDAIELSFGEAMSTDVSSDASCALRGAEPAPVLAARLVTATPAGQALPGMVMRLATTRGTNALLERDVAPTALFVTKGFGDLLVIGEQQRPDLFALRIERPPAVYERVVEVDGRIDAAGEVVEPMDLVALRADAQQARDGGARVAAVALANSYVNSEHEQAAQAVLRDVGFEVVCASAELAPLIGYVSRAETTVVDASLRPVISAYIERVQQGLGESRLLMMTSAGGLTPAGSYRAMDSLLSGPAGGVAGAAAAAGASGVQRVIALDMGGTSTDVSRYDGDFEYQFEHRVGGARVMSAALSIETVAAGGGSICRCSDDRLTVGPASAGAEPGPACYGAGGPLTLTDVNLLCGRIDAKQFSLPVDVAAAQQAFDDLCETAGVVDTDDNERDALLDGLLEIANERMASAIERISLRKGYDPAEYALVAFGGAGGQHACGIAQRLGMNRVIVPADASLLSAVGLGHAVVERFAQRQVLQSLEECGEQWEQWLDELSDEAVAQVAAEGVSRDSIVIRRRIVRTRLAGQDATLDLEVKGETDLRAAFDEQYRRVYGYEPPSGSVEIESMRAVASQQRDEAPAEGLMRRDEPRAMQRDGTGRRVTMRAGGGWHEVTAQQREAMGKDVVVHGPALITEPRSAIVVEPGWSARIDDAGAVVMEHNPKSQKVKTSTGQEIRTSSDKDPQSAMARAELFAHRLTSIAVEMGQLLQRTAMSTNVKQRLDFSCAVLNADGELVVNAPHLPVHLGAMGVCVREVRSRIAIEPGDVVVTNHPACGGSHLPDVTVISGAFDDDGELIGYVANRAHHAEIGGARPGSMPPNATRLIEEGVVIEPQYLVRGGRSQFDVVEEVLGSGRYPSRAIEENIADLRAQAAANHFGAAALRGLAATHGLMELREQMGLIEARAERVMRRVIGDLPARLEAEEFLDDGARVGVRIQRDGDELVIDVDGDAEEGGIAKPPATADLRQAAGDIGQAAGDVRHVGGKQHPGNLNAPVAVTHSAVLYVLRLLAGEAMPLNEGMMRPVRVRVMPGMLNPDFDVPAEELPAVVGGNVETSQRVVDTLLKAFGLCACSQGTMNNTLFGNARFGYYETVCGGAGAGPGFDGADAVHTHMTNTRITDVEVMEQRYPVRVRRFGVRRGSGGAGEFRGGDGAVRELEFLEDVELSVLSQHREQRPYGMNGGEPGAVGRQRVVRAGGEVVELAGIAGVELERGDRFVLETPGGGGWGEIRKSGGQSADT